MKSIFLFALVAVLVTSQAPDVSAGKLGRHRLRPKLRPDADRITELLADTKAKLAANREAADTTDRDKSVFRSFILAVTATYESQKENVMDASDELENNLMSGLEMQIRSHFKITPQGLESRIEKCENEDAQEALKLLGQNLEDELSVCGDDLSATLLEKQKEFLAIGQRIDELKATMSPCVGDLTFAGHNVERRGAGTIMSSVLFNELAGIGLGVASDQIDNLLNPRTPSCVPPDALREVAMMPREVDKVVLGIKLLIKGVKRETKQCIKELVQQHPSDAISSLFAQCNE